MTIKLSTNEQQESYEKEKICYICGEKFEDKYANDETYCKVRDHCHNQVNTELLHLQNIL